MVRGIPKPAGYWTEERTIIELREVVRVIEHFPTQTELKKLNRIDLHGAIMRWGGFYRFRALFGYNTTKKPADFWTYTATINELQMVVTQLGHFPTESDLRKMNRYDLSNAISKHGGFAKFRELFGYKLLHTPIGYWNDNTIRIKLREIINRIGHFPTHHELKIMNLINLSHAIIERGGIKKFRDSLGCKSPQRQVFWTLDNTVKELKKFIDHIGHFPTLPEFIKFNRLDLYGGVIRNGGTNKFRNLLGYSIIQHSKGDWTNDFIVKELKAVADKLGHFPTETYLIRFGKSDLVGAINRHGNMNKFRMMSGFPMSLHEKYRSELASYINIRGRGTERIINALLIEWCNANNQPAQINNIKLAKGNVIEFVCNLTKKIGIDVTNTRLKETISRKWTRKDYYKYLDELWIVVFSNVFTNADYEKWNTQSPLNVKVMSIEDFLVELDISTDKCVINKIANYKNCTFRSKEELKDKYREWKKK